MSGWRVRGEGWGGKEVAYQARSTDGLARLAGLPGWLATMRDDCNDRYEFPRAEKEERSLHLRLLRNMVDYVCVTRRLCFIFKHAKYQVCPPE
jgi:hypothetical protein